jgi:hypothetical protein
MKVGNNENAGVVKMFFILECVGFTRIVSNSGLDLAPILSKKLKFMTGKKNKSIVTFILNPTSTDDGIKWRAKKSELKKR